MYEILSGVSDLPMDHDAIMGVKRGMNKVRVSVGEHVSEPSEVYILTCGEGGVFSSFIVLFMVQPKVRILYGYHGNPYGPEERQAAETEAVDFVETMGSILEDLPWTEMSGPERTKWLEGENLIGAGVEEILETSDVYEVEDIDEADQPAMTEVDEEMIVLEPVEEAGLEKAPSAEEPEPEAGKAGTGRGETGGRFKDEEGGEIRDVLQEVFLKPEHLASARRKVRYTPPEEIEAELKVEVSGEESLEPKGPAPARNAAEQRSLHREPPQAPPVLEKAAVEQPPPRPTEPPDVAKEALLAPAAPAQGGMELLTGPFQPGKGIGREERMKVLRFLSRM